jgi:hypothetical protein
MSVDLSFAGEERQGVAVGLRHRFVLREVDPLAAPALLHLPQRHQELDPAGVLEIEAHRQFVLGVPASSQPCGRRPRVSAAR